MFLNSDAQVRPLTRRPSSAITLSLFHFLAAPEKMKKFNYSYSRGILCFLNHSSFPKDESEPGFKDQKIQHYSLFHCSASEIRCEVFPVSELITIHRFEQTLISLYSPLFSFRAFCMISLSSLSALCFLAHFTASLSVPSISILLGRHLY